MQIGPTVILDSHAEAFAARYARLIVTAADPYWVDAAARAATGYGTSVIGCDSEAGIERTLRASETPDGRPGAALLFFAFTTERLAGGVANRVGQCVMTCPSTACYNALPDAAETIPLGDWVRFFGDGFESQASSGEGRATSGSRTQLGWQIPVMDGQFVVDAVAGVGRGIGGGNLVIQAESEAVGLTAAARAAAAIEPLEGVIAPFPGGVCRAGSKVGSKYTNLIASTDAAYCPALRDEVATRLVEGAVAAYEVIVNGVDEAAVRGAMRAAIEAAAGRGVLAIGARSFDGKLGRCVIRLHELFS